MGRLAEFRADLEQLAEPVIPGVRADLMRAVETMVTDMEHLVSGLTV